MCNFLLWFDGMVVRIVADLSLPCDLSCVQSPVYLISPLVALYHPIIGCDGLSFSCLSCPVTARPGQPCQVKPCKFPVAAAGTEPACQVWPCLLPPAD